jgi:hypothetical protein
MVLVMILSGSACHALSARKASERHQREPFAQPFTAEVVSKSPSQFASMPRVPGETIPLHPTKRSQEPTQPQPTVPAEIPNIPDEGKSPPNRIEKLRTSESVLPIPDPPLVSAVKAYMEGKPELMQDRLKFLEKPNQELMLQLIPALVKASQTGLSPSELADQGLATQLQQAATLVAKKSSLTIDKAVFCRSVKNFGHYDPVPLVDGQPIPFKPGEIYILYVEIGNIPCEPTVQNELEGFMTRLSCSLELRDADGKVIELTDRARRQVPALQETKNDFSRSMLRDYFMLFWFAAPSRSGNYSVKFTVSDPSGGREVSRRVPFRVQ